MDLITTNSRYSFDPTPRLKSSPVPILFIPLNNCAYECNYCKSKYSESSYYQLYCKNCLFDYVKNLIDKNTYLDVHIHTENTQYNNKRITCKLCGYKSCTKYSLCPNCYLIYSERIESTLDKKPIPIIYLPWWDNSSICIDCERNLEFISDCQKWCSHIEYHLKDFPEINIINKSNHQYIINYMNNIDQKSNLTDSINAIKTIGFIFFIPFNNNLDTCHYCVHIITKSIQCTEHESRNLDFCTQNIQEWYYYIVSSECTILNLTRKTIPILHLPWWDTFSNCIVCIQELEYKSNYQKWCLHCFIIYSGCKYCLTTNIFFGCIKCKRVEPISTNGNSNIDVLNFTIENNNEITNDYVKRLGKDNNPLKIYNFIKDNLEVIKNIKIINYSEIKDFERIAEGGFGIIYKAT
ncbi:hypothetical protein RhiirC2_771870 [Rhizophagus irregularis]|uniref:Uncharacterized protein n=1 Tax=Rhizophagus irregularis TaxID=588596 RepID=A0A2N1NSW9_9GLOM|nr:hypothetical protein RhiirC2_771870 [Rhizophagus irregularis]